MNTEAFKLARATLRTAVKDYGWSRERTCIGYYAHDHVTDTYAKEQTVTLVRANYRAPLGKFQGEHWSIVHYYYYTMMDGCGEEPLYNDGADAAADLFKVTDTERAAFAFYADTAFVALWHSSDGFVSLEQLTAARYDKLRAEFDNQDQE